MPAQDGVRRYESRDLREQLATKPVSQYSEASAVAVVETQALPGEPSFQNAILLPQESDDISLLTLEPATQSSYQQLEREHSQSLRHRRRSICGTLRALGLGVRPGYDWSKQFYQYGNRLAHAYLLDRLNGIPTRLVFLYLIGDEDVSGPATRAEWDIAIHTVHHTLGLSGAPSFVTDVFIDVRSCMAAATLPTGHADSGSHDSNPSVA
jgi:hypothetical protein